MSNQTDRAPTIRQIVQAALRAIGRAPVAEAFDHEGVTILAVFSAEELLAFAEAVAAQVEQETMARCAPYMQHTIACDYIRCRHCRLTRYTGHHADSYNGDTTWHEFEALDCDCGLSAIRSAAGREA